MKACQKTISDLAAGFDAFVSHALVPWIKRAPNALSEPMLYSMCAPGKRLRPALLLMCAGSSIKHEEHPTAFYAAASMEAMHSYSLIHDDLPAMDDDKMRRGQAACHIRYSEWAAILGGDALHSFSIELLLKAAKLRPGFPLEACLRNFLKHTGMEGMIAGQALDLQCEREASDLTKDERIACVQNIHEKKTAGLFSSACYIGALLGGAAEARALRYQEYGRKLGLLFQIQDDILDITGEVREMGKAVAKDGVKLTYPSVFGLEESCQRRDALEKDLQKLVVKESLGKGVARDYSEALRTLPSFVSSRNH